MRKGNYSNVNDTKGLLSLGHSSWTICSRREEVEGAGCKREFFKTAKVFVTMGHSNWIICSLGCVSKTFRNVPTGRYEFLGLVRFDGKLHHEKSYKRTYLL